MAGHARLCRVFLLAGIAGLGAPSIGAQQARTPGPTATQDPASAARAMMQSGDARQQAWGAWYAGRDRLRALVPELRQVLAQRLFDTSTAGAAALDTALDSLIELKQPPPAGMLSMIFQRRPAQALILASSAHDDEVDAFLRQVLRESTHDFWFAAANLLLHRQAPDLASELLNGLRLEVKAVLVDSGSRFGGGPRSGEGVGCGARTPRADGFPPWPAYDLTTHARTGVSVLAMGPVPVFYRRMLAGAGQKPGFCDGFTVGPTADHRIRYLGALAGIEERALPLRGYEFHAIEVRDAASADAGIQRVTMDVTRRYARLMSILVNAKRIPSDEASRAPEIDLEVIDWRR